VIAAAAADFRSVRLMARKAGSPDLPSHSELRDIGERVGFDGGALATASRFVAKVDCAAVLDGFDLHLHGFIVTDEGD
jgi:uncharacterized protein